MDDSDLLMAVRRVRREIEAVRREAAEHLSSEDRLHKYYLDSALASLRTTAGYYERLEEALSDKLPLDK